MKYDGPAFFRRRDLLKARTPKKEKRDNASTTNRQRSAPGDLMNQQTRFSDARKSDDQTPAFLKEIRNFVPSHPEVNVKQRKRQKQIETNYFVSQKKRRSSHYAKLIALLKIPDDDLILLDNEAEKSQTVEASHLASPTAASPSQTSSVSVNKSAHGIQETADAQQSQLQESKKPILKSTKSEVKQPSSTDAVSDEVTSDNHSAEARPIHHGLGQSLSTIVRREQPGKVALPLFHENDHQLSSASAEKSSSRPQSAATHQSSQTTSSQMIDQQSQLKVTPTAGDASVGHNSGYRFPPLSLLKAPQITDEEEMDEWIERQIETLDKTFQAFKVNAQVADWTDGPTVTQFQVKLALGVKVSRITNLTDDLKLALAAKDIRIEAPIPGKSTVGIEIPNPKPRPVVLSEIISAKGFKDSRSPLMTAMGVDLSGAPRIADIRKMPHGLIAGATGSGKSVFINSLLVSLLYKATPADLKLLLIDPKAVELAPYDGIPHLLSPVISDPKSAAAALHWVTKEMDDRYEKLSAAGVRNIEQFNKKAVDSKEYGLKMPYILVIIDELADLMMAASGEVEDYIVRITQKARAAGIHLIVATQRPSVDIVTGTIKNNIPSRIAFMVSSQVDSRTILDTAGAERLLGRGDMLYLGNGASQPIRLQGAFVNNGELEKVIDFVRQEGQPHYLFTPDSLKESVDHQASQDELMPKVMTFIAQEETISTSKLQRVFSIGYNRAANIIDSLQERNLISEQRGSKPRTVYYHPGDDASDESEEKE